jgi:hypothetical protein
MDYDVPKSLRLFSLGNILFVGLSLVGLALLRLESYILFHSFVEIITILFSFSMFIIMWNTRRYSKDNFLVITGIYSLFIALIDILHTLAYKGMGVFPVQGANLATQLWIVARFFQAAMTLFAIISTKRKINMVLVLSVSGIVASFLLASVFLGIFPPCYIEGSGLTLFKRVSEYLIIAIFSSSFFLLLRRKNQFDGYIWKAVLIGIFLMMVSEFCFTLYFDVYGFYNMLGHYFRLLSVFIFSRAVLFIGLLHPFQMLFRDLGNKNDELSKEIASRKLSEEAALKEKAFLDELFFSAPESIVIIDKDGIILKVNAEFSAMFGYSPDEATGRNFIHILASQELADEAAQSMEALKRGERISFETRRKRKDGSWIEVRVIAVPVRIHGSIEAFYLIYRDLTMLKEAERKILTINRNLESTIEERTRDLLAANKELEAFSYSASHDIRTPLRAIAGFSEIVIDRYQELSKEDLFHYLDRIDRNAKHLEVLIESLLGLYRISQQKISRKYLTLSDIVRTEFEIRTTQLPHRRFNLEIEDGLTVNADPILAGIVIANLADNAIKFTESEKIAEIKFGSAQDQGSRVFYLSDNGIGFNMEYSSLLFTPFQHLHDPNVYEGAGMGLAIVQRILTRHGGRIWVDSRESIGTTFYFTFD